MSGKANKRAKKLEEKLQRAREFETVHEELIRTAEVERQTQSAPPTPYKYATICERVQSFSQAIKSLDFSTVTKMTTLADLIVNNKKVANAKARRAAALDELDNTCNLFNTINVDTPNVRQFTLLDKRYESDLETLKEENKKFTQVVAKVIADYSEDSTFKALKNGYTKALFDAFNVRDKYYNIIQSKNLFPPVPPPSGPPIDMGAILDKLTLES